MGNRKNFYLVVLVLLIVVFLLSSFLFKANKRSNILLSKHNIVNSNINKINLNFDSIFKYVDPQKESVKNKNLNEFTLVAIGDVIPARSVNWKMAVLNNYYYPFEKTDSLLKSADITLANLEAPLTKDCRVSREGMTFCGNQIFAESLKKTGINVVNLANNHTTNYGIDGINQTVEILKQNNIQTEGMGSPAIINIRGKKFGFLGYNDIGVSPLVASSDAIFMPDAVRKLKKTVNFVVVSVHWGIEYTSTPSARQIELAHSVIDAGADLVIGNHPHWVEGVELYKEKFITYAHGNYIFDQMWSQETREGVIGKYTFDNNRLIRVEFIPVIIDDYSQPRFASKNEAENILNKMKKSTEDIKLKVKL